MTDIIEKQEPTPDKKGTFKVCRHYKKGFCGLGDNCSYRHITPKIKSSVRENCRFYKVASCKFASNCRNKHIRPNGKEYPRPAPLNKFIVVGPSGKEPDETEELPVQDPVDSAAILPQEVEIRFNFKPPKNQSRVSKNCFYYEQKGKCYYGDKCWYIHGETYTHPAGELLDELNPEPEVDPDYTKMCYNFIFTECEFGDECPYVHGTICNYCDLPFLNPFDEQQQNEHIEGCTEIFKVYMNNAFKTVVSRDKMCAICLDYVWGWDKLYTKQMFGIQEKCNHIFCLGCIRRWRAEIRSKITWTYKPPLACPACRVESHIVVPSSCWFEDEKEKEDWIVAYKAAIADKPCKFHAKGKCKNYECPFLHSELAPVGGIEPQGEWQDVEQNYLLPFREQAAPRNVADAPQLDGGLRQVNVVGAGEILYDPDIWDFPPEEESSEDLLLQSSDHESSRNLAEATDQQYDDDSGQVDSADVGETQDEESQGVVEDPDISLDDASCEGQT